MDTKHDDIEEAEHRLQEALGPNATVLASDDAFRLGLYGRNEPSPLFTERLGDIVVLPTGNRTVWYRGPGMSLGMDMLGVHGGMTRDEMLVPFGISRLSDLMPT